MSKLVYYYLTASLACEVAATAITHTHKYNGQSTAFIPDLTYFSLFGSKIRNKSANQRLKTLSPNRLKVLPLNHPTVKHSYVTYVEKIIDHKRLLILKLSPCFIVLRLSSFR